MNKIQLKKIVDQIRANTSAETSSKNFVKFSTGTTSGYVPRQLVGYFAQVDGFTHKTNRSIRFSEKLDSYDKKTDAISGLFKEMVRYNAIIGRNSSWEYEGRFVGGTDRLQHPEFEVDRQYFQYLGFEADAVFLEIRSKVNGEDHILLQKRSKSVIQEGLYSFAASGATKSPAKSNREAAKEQISHELSPEYTHLADKAKETASTLRLINVSKKSPDGSDIDTLLNIRTQLLSVEVDSETARKMTRISNDEASGYELVKPQQVIEYCLNGTIAPVLTQAYMASMIATGLMPESMPTYVIKDVLKKNNGCVFAKDEARARQQMRPGF